MKTDDYLIRCPYYRKDRQYAVCCEGMHGGMQMHMTFFNGNSKRIHKKRFCRSKWADCPWASARNRQFDYEPPL